MRFASIVLLFWSFLLPVAAFAADPVFVGEDAKDQEQVGTILQIGVPVIALGLTFLLDDELTKPPKDGSGLFFDADTILRLNGHPRHDLALALGRTLAATYALKYSINEERPNGADSHSFPSGHTSVSFAGAEFIRKEYGWGWGIPAYLAASFVGYTRVKAKDHYTWDVVTGAGIGILSNHDMLQHSLSNIGILTISPGFAQQHPIVGAPWREDYGQSWSMAPEIGFELRF